MLDWRAMTVWAIHEGVVHFSSLALPHPRMTVAVQHLGTAQLVRPSMQELGTTRAPGRLGTMGKATVQGLTRKDRSRNHRRTGGIQHHFYGRARIGLAVLNKGC